LALSQGKDVFAVPGSIHSPLSRGCHALLRQGAKLVETAQDVLEELTWQLQGRSDGHQVENAKVGLAINQGLFGHGSCTILSV
jgi:DNA processing protein